MQYDFSGASQEAEKNYGVGGRSGFFIFQKGNNIIRILTPAQSFGMHFMGKGIRPSICYGKDKGCPFHEAQKPDESVEDYKKRTRVSVKYATYILDKADASIKLAELPHTVIKAIGALQRDSDYSFAELPIPYDIKVIYNPETTPADMYKIIPSPTRNELPSDILDELRQKYEKLDPIDYIERKKQKKMQEDGIEIKSQSSSEPKIDYPEEDINPEDIPF